MANIEIYSDIIIAAVGFLMGIIIGMEIQEKFPNKEK
jgi:uncharacterized protein YebE (UPF0316 family)